MGDKGMRELLMMEPIFKEAIWGGSRLKEVYGYDIPSGHTGECWAVSAHRSGDCRVSSGTYAGHTLSSLWREHKELFGTAADSYWEFPLLVKIIDAREDLSIQVHPDNAYAAEHENGSLGKMECWYILDCDKDGTIVIGHHAKDKEELRSMIEQGRWTEFIREVPIKKGDFFQINPGCVHAIKGGTLILLAACSEGSGAKDFFDWIEPLKNGCLDEALRKDFTIGGYIFYAACESIRKARTLLLSGLEPGVIKDMQVQSFKDMDTLLSKVDFKNKDVYIIPYGGRGMPQLKEEYAELCSNI